MAARNDARDLRRERTAQRAAERLRDVAEKRRREKVDASAASAAKAARRDGERRRRLATRSYRDAYRARAGTWRTGSSLRIWGAAEVRRPSMPSSRTSRSTASNTFEAYASSETILMRVCSSGRSGPWRSPRRARRVEQRRQPVVVAHRRDLRVVALQKRLLQKLEAAVLERAVQQESQHGVREAARQQALRGGRPPPRTSARAEPSTPPPAKRAGSCCTRVLTTSRGTAPAWETHAPTPPAAAYFASKPAVMSDAEHPTRRPRRP